MHVRVIIYHVYLKDKPHAEVVDAYPMAPVQHKDKAEVTQCHSVIEISKPRDQSPTPDVNRDTCISVVFWTIS